MHFLPGQTPRRLDGWTPEAQACNTAGRPAPRPGCCTQRRPVKPSTTVINQPASPHLRGIQVPVYAPCRSGRRHSTRTAAVARGNAPRGTPLGEAGPTNRHGLPAPGPAHHEMGGAKAGYGGPTLAYWASLIQMSPVAAMSESLAAPQGWLSLRTVPAREVSRTW